MENIMQLDKQPEREEIFYVKRAKSGDKEAFAYLIRENKASLYRVAKTMLKNEEDIGDAISGTILKAYENIGYLRKEEYFKTWLIRILKNCAYDIHRKNKKIVFLSDESNKDESCTDIYEDTDLVHAVESLEEELKLPLTLYYYEDMSIKDISTVLDVREGTVKSRLARARKILYSILKED